MHHRYKPQLNIVAATAQENHTLHISRQYTVGHQYSVANNEHTPLAINMDSRRSFSSSEYCYRYVTGFDHCCCSRIHSAFQYINCLHSRAVPLGMADAAVTAKSRPGCFDRNDVAHNMKVISGWKCLNGVIKRIRQIYPRATGLLIQCNSMSSLKQLLSVVCTASLREKEGKSVCGSSNGICAREKSYLSQAMGKGMQWDHKHNIRFLCYRLRCFQCNRLQRNWW